jgi:hypothetical protein
MPAYPSVCAAHSFARSCPSRVFRGLLQDSTLVAFCCMAFSGGLLAQCFTPGGLEAQSVSTQSLTLVWQQVNGVDSLEFEVRTGNQPFNGIPTHTGYGHPWTIGSLPAATRHRIRIRSVCGVQRSAWSTLILDVTTAGYNPTSCGLFFRIEDDYCPSWNTFYIQVDQAPGHQLGRDVVLSAVDMIVRHTFLADLHIQLVSPSGQIVPLFTEHGQSRDHLGNPADPSCTQVCRFTSRDCAALDPVEHAGNFIQTFLPDEDLHRFNDGSDPMGIWQLRICDDARADTGSLRFLELIFEPLECPVVYDARILAVSMDSAVLHWSLSGPAEAVLLEYGPSGFQPGLGAEQGAEGLLLERPGQDTSLWILGDLVPGTAYDFYLRTRCAGGSFSSNSCVLPLLTDCATGAPLVHLEDFDGLNPCGPVCPCGTVFPLIGLWRNLSGGDDMDWLARTGPASVEIQTGPGEDISGSGNYLFLQTLQSACQGGARAVLQSSCLAVSPDTAASCHFAFHYHMWGAGMGTLQVEASRDGGVSWHKLWSLSGNQGRLWHKTSVDLGAYRGDTIQLRITGISGPTRSSQLALDELRLYGVTLFGEPDRLWYRDSDGDGFGDPTAFVRTCGAFAPMGFVANALDCDDTNPAVYPGAPEVPCNGVDENCNGLADDRILPTPLAMAESICEGEPAYLAILSELHGEAYWFTDPQMTEPVWVGKSWETAPLSSETTFWVMDSLASEGCASTWRPLSVTVWPRPQIVLPVPEGRCLGDTLDLADLPFQDSRQTGAVFTFHSDSPAGPHNRLAQDRVAVRPPASWVVSALSPRGCRDEAVFALPVWSLPQVQIQASDTLSLCARQSSLVLAEVLGGLPPYQYLWSNGFSQFFAPVLAGSNPGWQTLRVTVTDSQGCRGSDSLSVETIAAPASATVQVTDVSVCGGEDGSLQITPSGPGSGPWNYAWAGPVQGASMGQSGSFLIQGLRQGSYRITITDPLTGCALILPPAVVNGPGPVVAAIHIQPESCPDAGDGAISLLMDGPPAEFLWSTGQSGPTLAGLIPGNYAVSISGGSCQFEISDLEVPAANPMVIGAAVTPATCAGGSDGAIHVTLNGGALPFAYQWLHGASARDLLDVPSGWYQLTVTDALGCTLSSDPLFVSEPNALEVTETTVDPSCAGASDGRIQLVIQGGMPSFLVRWSDGGTGRDRNALPAGIYAYTVTDQTGCVLAGGPLPLEDVEPLVAAWGETRHETCQGAGDGRLAVSVSGGTAPYQFLWPDGPGGSIREGLAAGSYRVTVTDQRGCSVMLAEVVLGLSDPLLLSPLLLRDPTCDALADGRIEVAVSGGSTPGSYQFTWSNGHDQPLLEQVVSGNYSLTVSDGQGCTAVLAGLVLEEDAPVFAALQGVYFPQCGLSSEGEIVLTVSGTGPFSYQWSHGFHGKDPKGLSPGFYSVTVTDAKGCVRSLESIPVINSADKYAVTPSEIRHIRCHGDRNGSITVEVSGGSAPFQFNWSNGQEKDLNLPVDGIGDLPPGNYALTITDNRGCVLTFGPVLIEEPAPLALNIPVGLIGNETCLGAGDGHITLDISGGVPPYSTVWFRNSLLYSIQQSPQNLSPGKYTAQVEDKRGCIRQTVQPIEIFGPPSLLVWQSILLVEDECSAEQTGMIELKMSGGVPDYNYLWQDGAVTKARSGLDGGWYCVTVTDQFHCLRDTCILLPGGSGIEVHIEVLDECHPYSSAQATAQGGVPPYLWQWSDGSSTSSPQGMATGDYDLTVTDALGCAEVIRGLGVGHPILYIAKACGIPASPGLLDGRAVVVPKGGTPPYQVLWDVNTGSQTGDTAYYLAPGVFCALVTDAFNCFDTACVEVGLGTSMVETEAPDLVIRVFPNPTTDHLQLQYLRRPVGSEPREIRLADMDGRIRLRQTWGDIERSVLMDLGGLPSGVYSVLVYRSDGLLEQVSRVVLMGS